MYFRAFNFAQARLSRNILTTKYSRFTQPHSNGPEIDIHVQCKYKLSVIVDLIVHCICVILQGATGLEGVGGPPGPPGPLVRYITMQFHCSIITHMQLHDTVHSWMKYSYRDPGF